MGTEIPLTKYVEIKNEYAYVLVRLVSVSAGVRLEVYAPNFDTRVLLDPLQLESLTVADESIFKVLVRTLYNPYQDDSLDL